MPLVRLDALGEKRKSLKRGAAESLTPRQIPTVWLPFASVNSGLVVRDNGMFLKIRKWIRVMQDTNGQPPA